MAYRRQAFASATYLDACTALDRPGNQLDGVPAGMFFFLGTVVLLAAIGDLRVFRAGGIHGTRRLARHLWRMCFGLFIASGSFAAQLVMMTSMPAQLRSVPMILVLGGGPLVVLVYWMIRIRMKENLRDLITVKPIAARRRPDTARPISISAVRAHESMQETTTGTPPGCPFAFSESLKSHR